MVTEVIAIVLFLGYGLYMIYEALVLKEDEVTV